MSGPIRPPLRVRDTDSSPNVIPVNTIVVSDGDLVDDGGAVVTIDTSGSGGSPATPANAIQFNSDPAGTFTGSERLLFETGSNNAQIFIKSGASALQTEIRAVDGWGMQIGATNADNSIRNQIVLYGENDGPDGILLVPNTGENVKLQNGGLTTSASDGDLVLSTYADEDKAKITLEAGAGGGVVVQTDAAGVLQLENTTTDADSIFTVLGNGTGTPKVKLENGSMAVQTICEANKKFTIEGGNGGDTFVFDVSSATGGITWPDGTEQITAASGVSWPLVADAGSEAAPSYTFTGDTDTGIFSEESNEINFTMGGNRLVTLDPSGFTMNGGQIYGRSTQVANSPAYAIGGDSDSGMFRADADILGFSTGGVERIRFAATGQLGIGGANYGTDGQVLTSTGASTAPAWEDAGGGGGIGIVYPPVGNSQSTSLTHFANISAPFGTSASATQSFSTDSPIFIPIIARRTATFTDICCVVTTGVGSTSLVDLGLYSDNAGQPGTLLGQATVDVDTSGTQRAALVAEVGESLDSVAGTQYWLAMVRQAGVATFTMQASNKADVPQWAWTGYATSYGIIVQSGSDNTLPATAAFTGGYAWDILALGIDYE